MKLCGIKCRIQVNFTIRYRRRTTTDEGLLNVGLTYLTARLLSLLPTSVETRNIPLSKAFST